METTTAWGMRGGLSVALGVVAVMACGSNDGVDDNQFRKDVTWCEDAAAHVTECCPDFVIGTIACRYYYDPGGCNQRSTLQLPQFDESVASCLRAMSCADMVARGVCTHVSAVANHAMIAYASGGDAGPIPTGPVCP